MFNKSNLLNSEILGYIEAMNNFIDEGLIILNKDGYISYANDKALKIIEHNKEQIISKQINDIISLENELNELSNILYKHGSIEEKNIYIKLTNGKSLNLHIVAIPIKNDHGTIALMNVFKEIENIKQTLPKDNNNYASFNFDDIIFKSKELNEIIELTKTIKDKNLNILIQGESGTGKELIAHAIHNASNRANKPFIVIDCSAIPKNLAESELFGYVEGAFTGAKKGGSPGKFELANGGTIFLDEIGEMSIELQAKFLRVLQSKKINRIGSSKNIDIDTRIISATNRDLVEEIMNNKFRSDLFYRLNVFNITIPPLRKRKEDIVPLANYFIDKYNTSKRKISIPDKTWDALLSYSWPGNVCELENVINRAVNICTGCEITVEDLPENIWNNTNIVEFHNSKNIIKIEDAELQYIRKILKKNNGNKRKTAEELGISRSTLYRKLNKTFKNQTETN